MSKLYIASTFYSSKQCLTPGDAQRVDDFIQKLQQNPANPGLGLERVTNGADANMWSARITLKLRAILHKTGDQIIILHVGQHDAAYKWAERHKVAPHPVTGEIQIVEIPVVPSPEPKPDKPLPTAEIAPPSATDSRQRYFTQLSDDQLLSFGVPPEWVERVRGVRSDDELLAVLEKLPGEVGERLYAIALGEEVQPPKPVPAEAPLDATTEHGRRFYEVSSPEELKEILTQPFEKWMLFLHPSQRHLAEGEFSGPVKITGSAGTGKTVVAIHRARSLARRGKRVLLTTFTRRLCQSIQKRIEFLCSEEERARITVRTAYACATDVLRASRKRVNPLPADEAEKLIRRLATLPAGSRFSLDYVVDEWKQVIDAHGISSVEEYVAHDRKGRGIALTKADRESLWVIFEKVLQQANAQGKRPWGQIHREAEQQVKAQKPSFDAVIVDEVQDLSTPQIRLLAALAGSGPDNITLIGDAGQRIYPGGFSLLSLGVDCRGRSYVLKVNYRTTHQIARAAAKLRGNAVDDLQGGEEIGASQSILSGPEPVIRVFRNLDDEDNFVLTELKYAMENGCQASEIGIFARSRRALFYLHKKLEGAGIPVTSLDDDDSANSTGVNCGTMHGAKGLEFRIVFIVACRAKELPAKYELDKVRTDEDQQVVIERERNLLYVSMTRAREKLFITATAPRSSFLDSID